MQEPVEDGCRHHGVAENGAPLGHVCQFAPVQKFNIR